MDRCIWIHTYGYVRMCILCALVCTYLFLQISIQTFLYFETEFPNGHLRLRLCPSLNWPQIGNFIKNLSSLTNRANKLECLSIETLLSLVYYTIEVYPQSGAPFKRSICKYWIGYPSKNTLAYLSRPSVTTKFL